MISKIVVHHPGAPANAEQTYFCGAVFNVREIPTRLAEKLKTKPACLRVFETSEAAGNFACDGESLVDICGAIFTDRKASTDLLKLGGFSFEDEGDSTVIVYLRVDEVVENRQVEVIEGRGDASISTGKSSGVEIRDDNRGRKRTSPQVMAILQHAATYVWPRDENGIPLPCYNQQHSIILCEHAASPSSIRSKPNWVDFHVLSIYKHFANESNTPLTEIQDGVWQKVVRIVFQWRKDMIAGKNPEKNLARYALWQSSPYGKRWMSGIFSAPPRLLFSSGANTSETESSAR
jgi:hypothetical protein